jgi:hypothetical protein
MWKSAPAQTLRDLNVIYIEGGKFSAYLKGKVSRDGRPLRRGPEGESGPLTETGTAFPSGPLG